MAAYPGLRGQPFFKQVIGMAGDEVTVDGRDVYVNGQLVGPAKARTFDGRPLAPIHSAAIPEGHYRLVTLVEVVVPIVDALDVSQLVIQRTPGRIDSPPWLPYACAPCAACRAQ